MDDGSCIPYIYGCMDSEACNYNPDANSEQGNFNCEFPVEGFDCEGNCLGIISGQNSMYDSYGDGWNGATI